MATYEYPTASELQVIEQDKLPDLMMADPIFDHFPIVTTDASLILWEQRDNHLGLQQLRGLEGHPHKVNRIGGKTYQMRPGVYGEFTTIDEAELTNRRQWGSREALVNITDLVAEAQDQLLGREIDRVKLILWTLATTGTFSVSHPNGGVMHSDTFDLQTSNGSTWATVASATPLLDLRAANLLSRGHSVTFGRTATAYMNQVTYNNLIGNTNAADLGGRLVNNGSSVIGVDDINSVLLANDLPKIVVHDGGYLNDSGTFVPFVGNGVVVIVGSRANGSKLGEYRMTRNAANLDLAPGAYTRVIDTREWTVPGHVEVHKGHNGGPVIYYPSGIVILDVS